MIPSAKELEAGHKVRIQGATDWLSVLAAVIVPLSILGILLAELVASQR